jgi:hypothetical protein
MEPEPGAALHEHHDGRLLGREVDFHLAVGILRAQGAQVFADAEAGGAGRLEHIAQLGRGLEGRRDEGKNGIDHFLILIIDQLLIIDQIKSWITFWSLITLWSLITFWLLIIDHFLIVDFLIIDHWSPSDHWSFWSRWSFFHWSHNLVCPS